MDIEVHDTLRDYSDIGIQLATVQKEVERLTGEHRGLMLRLQDLLAGGKSTGDSIRDLVIRATGTINTGLEQKYRKLQGRLAGHSGALILFTFQVEVVTMSRRGGSLPGQSWDQTEPQWAIACGVLADERLQLDRKNVVLPVKQYAISSYMAGFSNYKTMVEFNCDPAVPNPLLVDNLTSTALDGYAEIGPEPKYDQPILCIGDKEVEVWFSREKSLEHLRKCREMLGHFALEPTPSE